VVVLYHALDHPLPAHQYNHLFGPGHTGVQEIPGHQHGRPGNQGKDDNRELVSLTLVDGDGIGQLQLIQLGKIINNRPVVVQGKQKSVLHYTLGSLLPP
jgi:hypothetical protein